jgi:predicted heme/steroid binding protein
MKKKNKYLYFFSLILSFTLLLAACANRADPQESSEDKTFTLSELAEFDGQDGKPAYIAVDGVVYDVSEISEWADGTHAKGRFTAGRDYSDEIRNVSPHGTGVLSRAKKVGTLVE